MYSQKFQLSHTVEEVFTTPDNHSHWFGYYNTSPLDKYNKKLLAHRVSFDGRSITLNDVADIGWFDMTTGEWNLIGQTKSFNWQQGAMLQWLNINRSDEVVYNVFQDGKFMSRIVDINKNNSRLISWPVYGVSPNGKTSISLQFERSYWCRAYHYENIQNPNWNVDVAEEDGIFLINLINGEVKRVISILDILKVDYDPVFANSKHWLEHIMINSSGNRFAFYHRFSTDQGFKTRIFTANCDGSELFIVPGWRDHQWSHLGWKDQNNYVVFGSKRLIAGNTYQKVINNSGYLGLILKKTYQSLISPFISPKTHNKLAEKSNYQLYCDRTGKIDEYSEGILFNDGHPSFTKDGRFMLTDTYADAQNYRHLILYSIEHKSVLHLGKFYSPFNSCDYRSDLHPRLSTDDNYIIIDTAHTGKHQMMVLLVDWNKVLDSFK